MCTLFIKQFIYFWLCWVFIAAQATLQLRCEGFSLHWLLLLQSTGSPGFSGCGTWARSLRLRALTGSVVVVHGLSYLLSCMCCLPDPGIESLSLALAGRFFTAEPPGESSHLTGGSLPVLRAQASQPHGAGPRVCGRQLPARVAQRVSISVSLSAQSLGPSLPAAFIYSARCSLGAGNGAFFLFVDWTLAGFFLLWEVSLGLLQAP